MDVDKPLWVAVKGGFSKPSWAFMLLLVTVLAVLSLQITTNAVLPTWVGGGSRPPEKSLSSAARIEPEGDKWWRPPPQAGGDSRPTCAGFFFGEGAARKVVMSIVDFGGVGDGRTSNTAAFRKAVEHAVRLGAGRGGGGGGAQLNVPRGRWVTGSFNLTSNFTLFLEDGAVILGSQDPKEWPIIEPLPSYGRGRERLGGRHISLIHGDGLNDVVVTDINRSCSSSPSSAHRQATSSLSASTGSGRLGLKIHQWDPNQLVQPWKK